MEQSTIAIQKQKKISKPGVHILLPRLRPQHVWPRNKFGKTEFSLYLTTRHRLMPQNHSICFLVSYKWRCPLKWWYPQIINFNGSFHFWPSIWGYPPFMETLKWALKQINSALPRQFRCQPPRNLSLHGMIWKHKLLNNSMQDLCFQDLMEWI